MKRLSDIILETICAFCGTQRLSIVHVEISHNGATALVKCECHQKDVLRFTHKDFGKVKGDSHTIPVGVESVEKIIEKMEHDE